MFEYLCMYYTHLTCVYAFVSPPCLCRCLLLVLLSFVSDTSSIFTTKLALPREKKEEKSKSCQHVIYLLVNFISRHKT